jgi:hypothetical protein
MFFLLYIIFCTFTLFIFYNIKTSSVAEFNSLINGFVYYFFLYALV